MISQISGKLYESLSKMIKLAIDENLSGKELDHFFLTSCDIQYFEQYGINLILSHQKTCQGTPLIVHCIEFDINTAKSIYSKATNSKSYLNLFFASSQIPQTSGISEEIRLCWYKTLRFEIGRLLQKYLKSSITIIDVDALFIGNMQPLIDQLKKSEVDMCIGSLLDFKVKTLFESSFQDLPWRTVKAGFSYYSKSKAGQVCLESICNKLFNFHDTTPPREDLKLYRAYYGDQIAILFTFLELLSAPSGIRPSMKCIGCQKTDPVSFLEQSPETLLWVPVKRARPSTQRKIQ